jgi:hypothetical protein
MEYRNAKFTSQGTIDCEINHPEFGWIPFTASPDDHEQLGRDIYAAASPSATPYVAPPPPSADELLAAERAAMVCTPAQMRLALLGAGLLAQVQAIADSDPAAAIIWEYATQIIRNSPLINAMGGENGFTPEQIDDLFRAAMGIET